MELDQLRALEALAEEGTLTSAAEALGMSQPALSRSMQRLEANLGQSLFNRSGRRVTLNETGRTAVDWAKQVLRDVRLMREAVDAAAMRAHTLRVGTLAPAPLWRLTGLMLEHFPQETLTSSTLADREIIRRVAAGSLDLGIVTARHAGRIEGAEHAGDEAETMAGFDDNCNDTGRATEAAETMATSETDKSDGEDITDKPMTFRPSSNGPTLHSCPLMRERLSVGLPPDHPLAGRAGLSLDDFNKETFLIASDIGFWRDRVDRMLPHATIIEQHDRTVFAQLRRSTPYCTFVSDASFISDGSDGRVVVPIVDDELALADFRLIIRADAEGLAAQLFDLVGSMPH